MSLMVEVFGCGKFYVNTLCLKDDADLATNGVGTGCDICIHDGGASAAGEHQRGKNPEERCLAATVGAEQSEDLRRAYFKRNRVQGRAVVISVSYLRNLNCRRTRIVDGSSLGTSQGGAGHQVHVSFLLRSSSSARAIAEGKPLRPAKDGVHLSSSAPPMAVNSA